MLLGAHLNGDTCSGAKYVVKRDPWQVLRLDFINLGVPAVLSYCSDRSLQCPLQAQNQQGLARTNNDAWYSPWSNLTYIWKTQQAHCQIQFAAVSCITVLSAFHPENLPHRDDT